MSMEKFRYGTKEIIATLAGVALAVCSGWLEIYLVSAGIVPGQVFEWVRIRALIVAITAVFFGPVSGVICGIGSNLLIGVMFESVIDYPEVFVLGLYGFFIGLYFGKTHYDRKRLSVRTFVDFNAIQIMTSIVCTMFIIPLFRTLIEDVSIYDSITEGARRTAGNTIVIGVICSLLILTVGIVSGSEKKSRGA